MSDQQSRYRLETMIAPLQGGRLYEGTDLTLQRTVLIHEMPFQQEQSAQGDARSAVPATLDSRSPAFLHMLDIEAGSEGHRVIYHYKKGVPLRQFTAVSDLPFQQALKIVSDFGKRLLEGSQERIMEVSLTPDNIWLTDDKQMYIVSAMKDPLSARNEPPSKAMARLLYELAARSEQPPEQAELVLARLWPFLLPFAASKKEAFVTAITGAWNEDLSLSSFIRSISGMIRKQDDASAGTPAAAAVVPKSAPLKKPPIHTEAPPLSVSAERPAEPGPQAAKSGWGRLGLRVIIGLSLAALGFAVFIGVFVFLIGLGDRNEKKDALPDETAKVQQQNEPPNQQPAAAAPAPAKPAPAPATPPKPAGDPSTPPANEQTQQPESRIPNLVGLTKEAAEKLAVESGFRYTYYLERNEKPAGTVYKQDPLPNQKAAKGTRITFWISKGL